MKFRLTTFMLCLLLAVVGVTAAQDAAQDTTPEPTPEVAPTDEAAPIETEEPETAGDPLVIEADNATFNLAYIGFEDGIRIKTPENGIFAVFAGTIDNESDDPICLEPRDLRLFLDDSPYLSLWSAAQDYKSENDLTDYEQPGTYTAMCVEGGESVNTVLVYDVPATASVVEYRFLRAERAPLDIQWQVTPGTRITFGGDIATDLDPTEDAAVSIAPEPFIVPVLANVRACPQTSCQFLGELQAGEEIEVIATEEGEAVDEGNTLWYQIIYRGREAYVYSAVVASANATPAPAATDEPAVSEDAAATEETTPLGTAPAATPLATLAITPATAN